MIPTPQPLSGPLVISVALACVIVFIFGVLLLIKRMLPEDFFKRKKWKLIVTAILVVFAIIYTINIILNSLMPVTLLTYTLAFITLIMDAIIIFVTISAIEGIVIIVKKKSYKKSKKGIIGCILALIFLNPITIQILSFFAVTLSGNLYFISHVPCGVTFNNTMDGSPAQIAGLNSGTILSINGVDTPDINQLMIVMGRTHAGDIISLMTDKGNYNITLGQKPGSDKGFLGVNILTTKYCAK